jgi:soluble lytic murein transglycosylase
VIVDLDAREPETDNRCVRVATEPLDHESTVQDQRASPDVSTDMSVSVRRRWVAVLPVASALLLAAFVSSEIDQSPATPEDPKPLTIGSPSAAGLLRECDLVSAQEVLEQTRDSRIAMGLAAHACGEHELAVALLDLLEAAHQPWEDWRLLALARSAAQLEELATAQAATGLLLEEHPYSPLRPLALELAVQVARTAEDSGLALSLVSQSREEPLPAEVRADLDLQAWELATELQLVEEARQAALSLLLHSPADATALELETVLRGETTETDWAELFTPEELLLRSENLIDEGLSEEALVSLAAVSEGQRGFDWHLVNARALVEARRGTEAIDLLVDLTPPDEATELDLEWIRAMAALDAGTARRGRQNLPVAERRQMRLLAHGHLWRTVQLGGASERSADALRLLFEEMADGEHFEQVRSILHQLQEVDPSDTSGTRYLWRLGWAEYRRRNHSGAIGYWSELVDIYPHSKTARGGLYWSARAHEALGNRSRATSLYEELSAAPSTDYYGKLARDRLGAEAQAGGRLAGDARAEWPSDARLARAGVLTDAGLDNLAMIELDLLADSADTRAEDALRSRVLARQGERRDSIQHLWQAFPVLGGAYQDEVPPDALLMYYPLDYVDIVKRFAADNDLAVSLLLAMIRQESAFDIRARSRAGARGLMQIMPATGQEMAQRMGLRFSTERLNDPTFSVQIGSRYFRQVLDMFDGRLELALAGYNAGPYRIRRLVRSAGSDLEIDSFVEDLRFEESKTYVKRIVLFADSYERLYPDLG